MVHWYNNTLVHRYSKSPTQRYTGLLEHPADRYRLFPLLLLRLALLLSLSFSFVCVCPVILPMIYCDYHCHKRYYYYYLWYEHECYNSCAHGSSATRDINGDRSYYLGNIPSSCMSGTIEGGTCSSANVDRTCVFRAFLARMVSMVEVRARHCVDTLE